MELIDPVLAVREGFALVHQDVRGRFSSEGVFSPFENEIEDGYDTIEHLSKVSCQMEKSVCMACRIVHSPNGLQQFQEITI